MGALDLKMLASMNVLLALLLAPPASAFGPLPANHHPGAQSGPLDAPWGIAREARTKRPSFVYTGVDEWRRPAYTKTLQRQQHQTQQHQPLAKSQSSALSASPASSDASDRPARPVRIIISGAPASGKGTQCEKIRERYGVVHLSTGDMLRAAVAAETDVGLQAKEYMDSGRLVPDEVIIGVVKERLKESDCQERGWLLDGFPRTPAQAQALADSGVEADCFLFLNVPDRVLVERVVGRRTDPETGKIYHMTFSPPDDAAVLSRLVQRSDDTEEKVKVRLEQFHANVDAVKDSYTDISVAVDGSLAPSAVTEAVFDAIESMLAVRS